MINRISTVVMALLFAGCAMGEPAKRSATGNSKPDIPPAVVREMVVTFDGSNCIYDGPAVLAAGEVTVVWSNLTDRNVSIDIPQFAPGHTYEEFWEYIGESGSPAHLNLLDWAPATSFRPVVSDPSQRLYKFATGSYAILCIEILDTGAASHHKGPAFWVE